VAFARLTGRSDQHVRERERARVAAEEIVERTGLDVDSTIGFSGRGSNWPESGAKGVALGVAA
jgi:hypothetical protein